MNLLAMSSLRASAVLKCDQNRLHVIVRSLSLKVLDIITLEDKNINVYKFL